MTPSESDRPPFAALTPDEARLVEEVCTRFERALHAGDNPDVEACCTGVPEVVRAILREELLALECELRAETATLPWPSDPASGLAQPAWSAATSAPLPVFEGYDQVTEIGHGGMGVVYRARNRELGRYEALKMIAGPASPRDVERFRFEAEAAAGLDHPNIVPVYGVGGTNGQPFLVMRCVEGRTLTQALPELRRDLRAVARLLVTLARAVQHAHHRGILHRDLKPGNILLDADGEPHILDFGLARRLESQGSQSVTEVAGTAAYMAPEQARGERGPTTAVDVYGLGTILYEALTGRAPFVGSNFYAVLHQAQHHSPPRPATLVPDVEPDLAAVCEKCLARNPTDRYGSAEALASELEHWLEGKGVSARRPPFWDWLVQVIHSAPPAEPGQQGVRRKASAWRLLLWLGLWILAADVAIFAVIWLDLVAAWAWGAIALRGVVLWAVYRRRLARFRDLDPREGHTLIVGLAHLAFETALYFMYLPLNPLAPATPVLGIFPPLQAATGMALFICGSTYWGRLLPVGLGLIISAPVLAWLPAWSPLLHAVLVPPALWWWAFCTRWYFMAEQPT